MSLQNVWHSRRVADTAAKACYICCKPSTSVLITPDNKDFFYICPVHLKDRNFCSPIINTEQEATKKKNEAMAREIEKVKMEYEEKQRKKEKETTDKDKGKEKEDKNNSNGDSKEKGKDGKEKEKKEAGTDSNVDADAAKERDEKIKSIEKSTTESKMDNSPRIFALHKNFHQMRIDRLRNIEMARRNRERLRDPSFFPSVPNKAP